MAKKRKPMTEAQKEHLRQLQKARWAAKKAAEKEAEAMEFEPTPLDEATETPPGTDEDANPPVTEEVADEAAEETMEKSVEKAPVPQNKTIKSGTEYMETVYHDVAASSQRIANLFGIFPDTAELRKAHDAVRDSLYWIERARDAIETLESRQ